ncbi:DEAD/DEAH box helicase family protein [Rhodococcus qingshengii]|uniref:DEAD/DEAH box helicase n=1 Tax=Rhodococcus TaxID=1827 RepID=UPI001E48D83C|nr:MULTISPECIES: DEAD/DEAH box helicase family protein [Rhodococcus]MCD2099569.1 DEAD/DEAH box helicase family protein [Rhodococcus rhodochrous]MCD2123937.1 DEAD/DEAH box helicase family protein [Rhodococcus rhodochrous]MCQ4136634.1 DEAD/DEAH box helicase family protein [Rhodococcus rhodochrous]MDJ0490580.1 DEAD/DEAH box helicase family protein [Rhodococcus qingshengii]
MKYNDTFNARPFQNELIRAVLNRFKTENCTVAIASPGSGKTLAYQAVATHLMREGMIEHIAVYAPRLSLAQQCELEWRHATAAGDRGHFELFDQSVRLERIRHRQNHEMPFTHSGETRTGFTTTYSSLASEPSIHLAWAAKHAGRFLLVADEAQFCGSRDTEGQSSGGTVAGDLIEKMSEYAAHTLLLTGTPYRSDGGEIVLAEYTDTDAEWRKRIVSHAEATYSDGIANGYLRPFEARCVDARMNIRELGSSTVVSKDLSEDSSHLAEVLRQPEVFKPLSDDVMRYLDEAQARDPRYKALIACMDMSEARKVTAYLEKSHPTKRVKIAVSADGDEAAQVLRRFKTDDTDVLVTVRMAFLGYDCKRITVVGLLTNYRDDGHLQQLVGRGLRMWGDTEDQSQVCRIVAPDDSKMRKFLEDLREQNDLGIAEKKSREVAESRGETVSDEPLSYLDDAYATHRRLESTRGVLDSEQLAIIESLKTKHGSTEATSILAEILREFTGMSATTPAAEPETPSLVLAAPAGEVPIYTESEQVTKIKSDAEKAIKKVTSNRLRARNVSAGTPAWRAEFGREAARIRSSVNSGFGIASTTEINNVDVARRYLNHVLQTVRG